MAKRKNNLENQPHFIQYAYLPLEDSDAVSNFFDSVKQTAEYQELEPTLYIDAELQNQILYVLGAWHSGRVSSAVIISNPKNNELITVEEWLNGNDPRRGRVFQALKTDLVESKEQLRYVYTKRDLRGLLSKEIIEAMVSGKKLKRCQAEDCQKYLIESPQGSETKHCSARCRTRIAKRKARKKEK